MTVTGLKYKFSFISSFSDNITEAEIPLTGDELVITQLSRVSYETSIYKYPLSNEAADQYLALIDKYRLIEKIGKEAAPPKLIENGHTGIFSLLTIMFDDGTCGTVTFREAPEEEDKEAAEEFRKLYFGMTKEENKISEEKTYPTLKECRGIIENHGPVVAVETGHYSSGMMYNSNQTTTRIVEKIEGKEGTVLVTVKKKAGDRPEVSDSKEITSDILSKIQEISDKENLPGWNYLCVDPSKPRDMSMVPLDYSSNSWLNIYYDDSLITGCPRVKRTIGDKAYDMGGNEVIQAIRDLVSECEKASGIEVAMPQLNLFDQSNGMPVTADPQAGFNPFMGLGMTGFKPLSQTPDSAPATSDEKAAPAASANPDGSWNCTCGAKDLTGKFCPECGNPRV